MFLWPEIARGTVRLGYADAGKIRTRYVEAGDPTTDEAVVFIPGTGGHLEAFTRNILPHAEHHRTIALDMVGHGYTDKPDHDYEIRHYVAHLLAFIDALELKRIHVHGESLGGLDRRAVRDRSSHAGRVVDTQYCRWAQYRSQGHGASLQRDDEGGRRGEPGNRSRPARMADE